MKTVLLSTLIGTAWPERTVSYGPVFLTWIVTLPEPIGLTVPPTQWQLQ